MRLLLLRGELIMSINSPGLEYQSIYATPEVVMKACITAFVSLSSSSKTKVICLPEVEVNAWTPMRTPHTSTTRSSSKYLADELI